MPRLAADPGLVPGRQGGSTEGAIDRYMRELSEGLLLTGRERVRALEEVEGQLREMERDIAGTGAAPADAFAEAVAALLKKSGAL